MPVISLKADKRIVLGKGNKRLMNQGLLPAVLYGHDLPTQSLQVGQKEFLKAFKQAGESTLITLNLDNQNFPVLIHEVQHHYLNDKPIHVDFYAVSMTEKLKAKIPIHFLGEAPAVKALGGVLVKNISEVEVECLPGDLPANFEIDISNLNNFEDTIRVSDIKVSDKVKILAHPDEVIVTVAAPRSEEELKELEQKPVAADVTAVEGVVKPEVTSEDASKTEAKIEETKEKAEKPSKHA